MKHFQAYAAFGMVVLSSVALVMLVAIWSCGVYKIIGGLIR